MKKDLFHFILLLLLLFLFTRIHSQGTTTLKPAADRASRLTEWMNTNLGLRTDQTPRVFQINLKYANKMDELKNSNMSSREKMNVFNTYDKQKDAELINVLTEQQFKAYQSKKKEIWKKFREGMKPQ